MVSSSEYSVGSVIKAEHWSMMRCCQIDDSQALPPLICNFNTNSKRRKIETTIGPPAQLRFSFFDDNPKWRKFALCYKFEENIPPAARRPVQYAFQQWSMYTRFNFIEYAPGSHSENENEEEEEINITIGMYSLDHGDDFPFDDLGEISHAWPLEDGRLHFNEDVSWCYKSDNKHFIDLQSVALHEIGHILGLDIEGMISLYPSGQ